MVFKKYRRRIIWLKSLKEGNLTDGRFMTAINTLCMCFFRVNGRNGTGY